MVVPEITRVLRDVLFAHQAGPVPGVAQNIDDVPLGMAQAIAAMRQAQHPGLVGALSGEQGGPRPGADRGGTEGLPEEHTLVGEMLDVRCRNWVPVGLHRAACVVRVQIEDVRFH